MTEFVDSPDLVGAAEAARITGKDVRTLHRMVLRGELATVTKLPGLRGAYVFNRSDIVALIPEAPAGTSPEAVPAGASPISRSAA